MLLCHVSCWISEPSLSMLEKLKRHLNIHNYPANEIEGRWCFRRVCLPVCSQGSPHVTITFDVLNLTIRVPPDMFKLIQLGPHCKRPPPSFCQKIHCFLLKYFLWTTILKFHTELFLNLGKVNNCWTSCRFWCKIYVIYIKYYLCISSVSIGVYYNYYITHLHVTVQNLPAYFM